MIDRLAFWLGEDASDVWNAYLDDCDRDAEEMRHLEDSQPDE